jgi:hypothetical protein
MKKLAFLSCALLLAAGTAQAQQAMSIGSGAGSLSFTKIYPNGHVDGDDATFNNGTDTAATTIWNNCFMIHDGTNTWWADSGFTTHTNQVTDGTVNNSGTVMSNTGMTYTGNSNLTSNLTTTLSAPTAGNTAQVAWAWTFNNSGGTAQNVRVIWFFDADSYIASNLYDDDLSQLVTDVAGYTEQNSIGVIAVGEGTADTGINLNQGVLLDVNVTPTAMYGVADAPAGSYGSSYYWSSQNNYDADGPAAQGPEVAGSQIPAVNNWTVQNDTTTANYISDTGGDVAGVIQVDLSVPASGNASVTFTALWGHDQTTAAGFTAGTSDWMMY